MRNLKSLINTGKLVRLLEAHNPLSALVVEQTGFDGIWSSSLSDSAAMALPDCEYYSIQKRLDNIQYIMNITDKPLIMDIDSGGHANHLCMHLKHIQNIGISGIIVEDKIGYKRNSLYGKNSGQSQDTPENFAAKLNSARTVINNPDFMLISRIESLILGETVDQALARSRLYIDSGTNGIMIHSVEKDPVSLLKFVERFRNTDLVTPLIVVPTTFNQTTATSLHNAGVNVVIYANHLIRSSMQAMLQTANQILQDDMSYNVDQQISPVKDLLKLIPENDPSHRFN